MYGITMSGFKVSCYLLGCFVGNYIYQYLNEAPNWEIAYKQSLSQIVIVGVLVVFSKLHPKLEKKLERILCGDEDMVDGLDMAEEMLRAWVKRQDVKVINWQIITVSMPIPAEFGGLYKWTYRVELFIEYEKYR